MFNHLFSSALAYIPSPTFNSIDIGPIHIKMYGLIIGLGAMAAIVWLMRRWESLGYKSDDVIDPVFFGIIAGFIGARFTYLVPRFFDPTSDGLDFQAYLAKPWRFFAVWEGGIAILGGLTFGGLTVLYLLHRRKINQAQFWDAAAPVLPLAQGIGRWGNYFNQELYGTPLDGVPWKLYIYPQHRRPGYADFEYFHPTFLYEFIWNFATVGLILFLERKKLIPKGGLIWVFGMSYGTIRLILEQLRTDEIIRYFGLSRNSYMAIGFIVFAAANLIWLFYRQQKNGAVESTETSDSVSADCEASDSEGSDCDVSDSDTSGSDSSSSEVSDSKGV